MQQALTFSSLIGPGSGGIDRDRATRPTTADASFGNILAETEGRASRDEAAGETVAEGELVPMEVAEDLSDSGGALWGAQQAGEIPLVTPGGAVNVKATGGAEPEGAPDSLENVALTSRSNAPAGRVPVSADNGEPVPAMTVRPEANPSGAAHGSEAESPPAEAEEPQPEGPVSLPRAVMRAGDPVSQPVGEVQTGSAETMATATRLQQGGGVARLPEVPQANTLTDSHRKREPSAAVRLEEGVVVAERRPEAPSVLRPKSAQSAYESFTGADEPKAPLPEKAASDIPAEVTGFSDEAIRSVERGSSLRVLDVGPGPGPAVRIFRPVATALAERVATASSGALDVRLSPEELGNLRISFSQDEAGLSVVIRAERPDTLELLRRHVSQFAEDLREQGYEGVSISFGNEGGGGTAEGGAHSRPTRFTDATSATNETIRVSSSRPVTTGGLDIRL